MSTLHYPIGLVAQLEIERDDRTLIDAFEGGTTASRAYWAALNFKRKFILTHAALKGSEFKYLKSFYNQRGQWDSFWFRDNISRGGNALVRFSQALYEERATQVVTLMNKKVNLDEVAPIRALPEFDEVATAAGVAPVIWHDANREFYLTHCGSVILDPLGSKHDVMGNYPSVWQAGTMNFGASIFSQYQYYNFAGVEWSKSAVNVTQLAGAQPACTIIAIVRHSSTSTQQILFAIGAKSSTNALGLQLTAANKYAPWLGAAESYTNAKSTNPVDTWQSVAAVFAASSNSEALYVNGVLIGTDTLTRSLSAGPSVLGAAFDGTLISNPAGAMTNANIAHVLVFAAALTLAQIKAVHNLLGYQYGIATVP